MFDPNVVHYMLKVMQDPWNQKVDDVALRRWMDDVQRDFPQKTG